jgi:hypothetical protein
MREFELHVESHQIIVSMMDTRLSITYRLSPNGELEENKFWTMDGGDAEFRQRAWRAARSKARQLGWTHVLKCVA